MEGDAVDEAPTGDADAPALLDPVEIESMPRWVPRAILLALAGVVLVDVGRSIVSALTSLLLMLLVSLFASFALEPAVNALARRGMRRGSATGIVLVGSVLALLLFVVAVGSVVVGQIADFVENAPDYVEDFETWANERFDADIDTDELVQELTDAEGPWRDLAANGASKAVDLTVRAVGILFQGFTILLFTFYLVADGPKLRRSICSLLRPERQVEVLRTWEIAIDKTGGYIYSRAVLAGASSLATWIALSIIGVPYALALALWVGVISQFIPTVGTYLGGALPVLIALFDEPVEAIWVLAFVVVYQQVENYLLAPRVTARTMEIHPAVAFGSVIVGASVLGPVGALLALPAAAVGQALGSTYLAHHEVIDSAMTQDHRRDPRPHWWSRSTSGTGGDGADRGAGD